MSTCEMEDILQGPLEASVVLDMPEPAALMDRRGKIQAWNPALTELTGHLQEDMLNKRCADCINEDGVPLCLVRCPAVASLHDGQPRKQLVFRRDAEGKLLPLKMTVQPVRDEEGTVCQALHRFQIDRRILGSKSRISQVERKNMLDTLTGLPNRAAMRMCLQAWLDDMPTNQVGFGVILVGVDHFEDFQSENNLQVCDDLLKELAGFLKNNVRATDVVSRWGMEKFIALIHRHREDALEIVAHRIIQQVAESTFTTRSGKKNVTVSASSTTARLEDTYRDLAMRAEELLSGAASVGTQQFRDDSYVR